MTYQFSAAGVHHLQRNEENQDAAAVLENERYTVLVLADGVSTCAHAGSGARLASQTAARLLLKCAEYFMNAGPELVMQVMLRNVRYALREEAARQRSAVGEFSSTLAFVLHDRATRQLLLFQLGDGLIVGSRRGQCAALIQPGDSTDGTWVTTTPRAEKQCAVRLEAAEDWEAVMLMTDGAWRALTQNGRFRPDAADAFTQGRPELLQAMLQQDVPEDDHTYLILKIR